MHLKSLSDAVLSFLLTVWNIQVGAQDGGHLTSKTNIGMLFRVFDFKFLKWIPADQSMYLNDPVKACFIPWN